MSSPMVDNSVSESVVPPLWLDHLPTELQIRIAQHVCEGLSGPDGLNLAKTSSSQAQVVSAALQHTLEGCFATHSDDLVNDWVQVFQDVNVLELVEHPPNFQLLSSPSLRTLMISDDPFQLEALAKSKVNLERLELTACYETPVYLVCQCLAQVTFKTLLIDDPKHHFFENLQSSTFTSACGDVETIILPHNYDRNVVKDFLVDLVSLQELDFCFAGPEHVPDVMLKRLKRIRAQLDIKYLHRLVQLTRDNHIQLKKVCLFSCACSRGDNLTVLGETIQKVTELENLSVILHFAESFFPRLPLLQHFRVSWFPIEDEENNEANLFEPKEGTMTKLLDGFPCLSSLQIFNVKLSQSEVVGIIQKQGSQLKDLALPIYMQDVSPHQRLTTILKSLSEHARQLRQLDLGYCPDPDIEHSEGFNWREHKTIILLMDRLQSRCPELKIERVEFILFLWGWIWGADIDGEREAFRRKCVLRHTRRKMNAVGGIPHLTTLAGLLETGCEDLEQDTDAAIKLYQRAVRMGDVGDAIVKLLKLTDARSPASSEPEIGGALELILEMDRRKLKLLPNFADLFDDRSQQSFSDFCAAKRVLQLAVENGYIDHYAERLALLVKNGYHDLGSDDKSRKSSEACCG